MAKIPGETDPANSFVVFGKSLHGVPSAVRTTVIHRDGLIACTKFVQDANESFVQDRKVVSFVECRHYDGWHSMCCSTRRPVIWGSGGFPALSSCRTQPW